MKHVSLSVALAVAALLMGCGGDGDNDPIDNPPLPGEFRVEAVVVDPSGQFTNVVQDPLNFQTNEDYGFQLVSY
ncbi:MAG TPA: hypothetical protein VGE01_02220, partial [Fimbriimonas sp.]